MNYQYSVLDRFLRYVQIDTQSNPHSETVPSTEKQKDLSRILVKELRELGVADVELDDKGYVYATLPSNTENNVPAICFCSHVDTSPETTGKNVKPQIHKNYQGGDIVLPADSTIVIKAAQHPDLANQKGNDIVTTDGTTLLGADDKAGLAEIMDMVAYFQQHPEIKHGTIKILFTPDEEIGRGANHVDIEKLGAKYGYTVDGESRGSMEDETFSADGATVIFRGVNVHPGYAKGRLENAMKMAGDLLAALPKDSWSPETTSGREGFVHPYEITGGIEETRITFILRSFNDSELVNHANRLRQMAQGVMANYPNSSFEVETHVQYRNMKNVLKDCPHVVDYAVEAIERAGMKAHKGSIRGGTDGSKLSFMGLPCPNLFAGGHSFHSKTEWVSVQDMQAAVRMLIELVKVWEEKGE
ncbi:MAG: peptidase T [Bacteroidetes bacterium]|nr:peptidase T [Bacteroidota bacterium]